MILVDECDQWLLDDYTWHIENGYARTSWKEAGYTQHVWLHHCIMGHPIWEDEEVDHENRNRLDNRRSNLRWVTSSEQRINRTLPLGVTGERNIMVSGSRYRVRIKRNWTWYEVGSFATLSEAIAARDTWLCQ